MQDLQVFKQDSCTENVPFLASFLQVTCSLARILQLISPWVVVGLEVPPVFFIQVHCDQFEWSEVYHMTIIKTFGALDLAGNT